MARVTERGGWKGLEAGELRELLFSYCKWLLLHEHTPHRVMKQPVEYPEPTESVQVKQEEDWPRQSAVKLEHSLSYRQ